MQISGANPMLSSYYSRNTKAVGAANPQFSNLMAVATEKKSDISETQGVIKVGSSSEPKKPDFSNMSAAEFKAEASAMFKRGEIDFDTMSSMVLRSGSIERMDAESGNSQNHDFVEIFKGYMSFLEKAGSKNDPTSGYNILEKVMDKIS